MKFWLLPTFVAVIPQVYGASEDSCPSWDGCLEVEAEKLDASTQCGGDCTYKVCVKTKSGGICDGMEQEFTWCSTNEVDGIQNCGLDQDGDMSCGYASPGDYVYFFVKDGNQCTNPESSSLSNVLNMNDNSDYYHNLTYNCDELKSVAEGLGQVNVNGICSNKPGTQCLFSVGPMPGASHCNAFGIRQASDPSVTFQSNSSSKLKLQYEYPALPEKTSNVSVWPYDDCGGRGNKALTTIDMDSIHSFRGNASNIEGVYTEDVILDINTALIDQSQFWNDTSPTKGEIKCCVKFELLYEDMSISFKETKLDLTVDMSEGFAEIINLCSLRSGETECSDEWITVGEPSFPSNEPFTSIVPFEYKNLSYTELVVAFFTPGGCGDSSAQVDFFNQSFTTLDLPMNEISHNTTIVGDLQDLDDAGMITFSDDVSSSEVKYCVRGDLINSNNGESLNYIDSDVTASFEESSGILSEASECKYTNKKLCKFANMGFTGVVVKVTPKQFPPTFRQYEITANMDAFQLEAFPCKEESNGNFIQNDGSSTISQNSHVDFCVFPTQDSNAINVRAISDLTFAQSGTEPWNIIENFNYAEGVTKVTRVNADKGVHVKTFVISRFFQNMALNPIKASGFAALEFATSRRLEERGRTSDAGNDLSSQSGSFSVSFDVAAPQSYIGEQGDKSALPQSNITMMKVAVLAVSGAVVLIATIYITKEIRPKKSK